MDTIYCICVYHPNNPGRLIHEAFVNARSNYMYINFGIMVEFSSLTCEVRVNVPYTATLTECGEPQETIEPEYIR